MQTDGRLLAFDFPGGQIIFHKDLKKFYEILTQCRVQVNIINTKVRDDTPPRQILDTTLHTATEYIRINILPSLSVHGVYNATVSDFLSDNFALDELRNIVERMANYESVLEYTLNLAATQAKAEAAYRASLQVTGLDYGIISNDIGALIAYDVLNQEKVAQQSVNAEFRYTMDSISINASTDRTIWEEKSKNRGQYTELKAMLIPTIFDIIALKYCVKLSEVGGIDLACLHSINERRSNELLNNIRLVPNQESVILQAIQLCPYNLNAYRIWFEQGLSFQEAHKEILDYFGCTEIVCDSIAKECDHKARTMIDTYNQNKRIILAVSTLKGQPLKQVAHDLLELDFQRLLKLYCDLSNFRTEVELGGFLERRYPNELATNYRNRLTIDLGSISGAFNSKQVHFCERECDLDVFKTLSSWFGTEITCFRDANNIVLGIWKKGENRQIETQRQKLEKELKNAETKLSNLKRNDGPARALAYIVLLGGIVGILPIYAGFHMVTGKYFDFFGFIFGIGLILMGVIDIFFGFMLAASSYIDANENTSKESKEIQDLEAKIISLKEQIHKLS